MHVDRSGGLEENPVLATTTTVLGDAAGYATTASRLRVVASVLATDHHPPIRLEARKLLGTHSLSSTLKRMSLAYADEAIHLREAASLSDRDIARATGSGVSTVSAWLRRERAPRGRRAERLVELSAIADRLAAVLGAERVPVWLNKPVPALEHRKPLDVIAAGGYEQVSRVVAELESPTFG